MSKAEEAFNEWCNSMRPVFMRGYEAGCQSKEERWGLFENGTDHMTHGQITELRSREEAENSPCMHKGVYAARIVKDSEGNWVKAHAL